MPQLIVGYIPEHFSTPLFFSKKYGFYGDLEIEFVPVIEGTGRLIALLNSGEINIAIGLTEGFVADISKGNEAYKLVGTYVESPLCWAISTGYNRTDVTSAEQLDGKKIGVSRIGSGSYIMSFVLGHKLNFSKKFTFEPLNNFENLRKSVNDSTTDAFMWEHFTSKKYYDNKDIKKIGEIYTPWPSWVITVNSTLLKENTDSIKQFLAGINKGIEYFNAHHKEACEWIAENLDYSEQDAAQWLPTVTFSSGLGTKPLDWESVVVKTKDTLKLAGVLTDSEETISQRLNQGIVKQLD